jgi:uncharacterized membrane protein YbhN (UPF0104 family)
VNTSPPKKDIWIYRIVVTVLGLTVMASVIGAIALTMKEFDTPELLVALGSAAIGGLAGLLAPSPSNR